MSYCSNHVICGTICAIIIVLMMHYGVFIHNIWRGCGVCRPQTTLLPYQGVQRRWWARSAETQLGNVAWWRCNSTTLHFSHNFQKILVFIKYLFYIPHFVIFAQKRSGNRIFVHCFTSFNCTYTKAPTTQDISPITSW